MPVDVGGDVKVAWTVLVAGIFSRILEPDEVGFSRARGEGPRLEKENVATPE